MTPKCLAVKTAKKKLSLIEMQRSEEEMVWKKISRKHFYSCEFEMSTNLYTYPNLHVSIYLFFFSLKKKWPNISNSTWGSISISKSHSSCSVSRLPYPLRLCLLLLPSVLLQPLWKAFFLSMLKSSLPSALGRLLSHPMYTSWVAPATIPDSLSPAPICVLGSGHVHSEYFHCASHGGTAPPTTHVLQNGKSHSPPRPALRK